MVGNVSDDELEKLADLITERILVKLEKRLNPDRYVDIYELAEVSKLSVATLFRAMRAKRLTGELRCGSRVFNLKLALDQIKAAGKDLTKGSKT